MAENQRDLRAECLAQIEQQLGWGQSVYWSDKDFGRLSQLIFDRTKVQVSITTLKRIWGRVSYSGEPATSTMDALAGFLGFDNWRSFVAQQHPLADDSTDLAKAGHRPFSRPRLVWLGAGVLLTAVAIFVFHSFIPNARTDKGGSNPAVSPADFELRAMSIAPGLPTSVVFTYDAEKSPTDSVFIQQHWDPAKRVRVPKNGHTHTSIYYEPGFFNAKLILGNQVVKEYPLLIPTDGWLATIDDFRSTPIHLEAHDFLKKGLIDVQPDIIEKYGLNPLSDQVEIKFYHVGQFKPVPANDFVFSAQVKSNSLSGRDPCRYIWIRLVTERHPIIFPLSVPGCISNLSVSSIDSVYSGKDHDFSRFGTNLSDWVDVKCTGTKSRIKYFVNNQLVFEVPMVSGDKHIMGMIVGMSGGGSVRNISIHQGREPIFEDFDHSLLSGRQ